MGEGYVWDCSRPLHPLKNQPDLPLPLLSQHYAPSVFEKYTASVTVGNKEVTLNLYDTAGECTRAQRVPVVIPKVSPAFWGIPFLTP